MSELIHAAIDDLTAAVRTTIDLAIRAASWMLLPDDQDEDDDTDAAEQ